MRRYRFRNFVIVANTSYDLTTFVVRCKGRLVFKFRDVLTSKTLKNNDLMTSYFKNALYDVEIGEYYAIF